MHTKSDPAVQGADAEVGASKVVYVAASDLFTRDVDAQDLGRMLRAIWGRRKWVLAVTFVGSLVGLSYALLATPQYRADAILLPREARPGIGLAGQLSQFAGLADIAGISLGSSGKNEPLGVLRSKGFARRFIESNELIDDIAERSGRFLPGPYATTGGSPDIREVVDVFVRSIMSVSEDKRSGIVTISVTWRDPAAAADWANKLAMQVNDEMRRRTLRESESNIRYLTEQMRKTELVSVQQSIARVLETEIQKQALANGTREYAFRFVDFAEPPMRRAAPRRTLIVVGSLLFSLILSSLVALMVDPARRILASAREK